MKIVQRVDWENRAPLPPGPESGARGRSSQKTHGGRATYWQRVLARCRGGPHGSAWRFTSVGAAGLHKNWIVVPDFPLGLVSFSGLFDHGRLA